MKLKHMIGAAVIVGALGYLGAAGFRSGLVYYVEIDQLLTQPDQHAGRVRVHGIVGGEIVHSPTTDGETRFELVGTEKSLPVVYRGAVPDGFALGKEVIVEGTLGGRSSLEADLLMTKCSSKYQRPEAPGKVAG